MYSSSRGTVLINYRKFLKCVLCLTLITVCRVKSNQALAKQRLLGNEIERDPEEVAAGDLEMFREANTDGSGKLCINQFLAYMGAGRNDLQAKLKFHQYVPLIPKKLDFG